MLNHLIFDTTDFETIEDTHSVGAFVRSGEAGALITHHASTEAGTVTFGFADGDVTVGTDAINEVAHGLQTGEIVRLTSSGTLPAGLALATDYYVIRVDNDNFKLAASPKDAERGIAVDITAAAGGGTHTVTEQDREIRALDVNLSSPISINVDLTQADEITVFQGTSPWIIGDGGGSITVDAANLDIRDLVFATDKVDVSGSEVSLDAATLAALENITVSATDLDIRDLVAATDSVSSWTKDGTGTAITSRAEDGGQALDVHITGSGSLTVNDAALAGTTIIAKTNPLGVDDTSEDVVASPLANRKYLWLYNNGNKKVFIGGAGVTQAAGFPLSPGSYMELRAGAAVDVEWIAANAVNSDLRTLELS